MRIVRSHRRLGGAGRAWIRLCCAVLAVYGTGSWHAQAQAFSIVSVEQEIAIGEAAQARVRARLPELRDPAVTRYVGTLGAALARQAPGARYPYTFSVADDAALNAFALPGGAVWINRGALRVATDESQVAAVLAHEVAHVARRHAAAQVTMATLSDWAFRAFGAFLGNTGGAGTAGVAARLLAGGIGLKFSRDDEREADRVGLEILRRAGWDPRGMVELLEAVRREGRRDPGSVEVFMSTHPSAVERIAEIEALIGGRTTGRRDSPAFRAMRTRVASLPPPRAKER